MSHPQYIAGRSNRGVYPLYVPFYGKREYLPDFPAKYGSGTCRIIIQDIDAGHMMH